MPAQATIGVLDSGVGGITILREIRRQLPNAHYAYCSDNQNFPYGLKSPDQVIAATMSAVKRLQTCENLDALVVACNTASIVALPFLRKHLSIEVIGVVPAIKPAAEISRSRVIGLLATPGSVQGEYTKDLIKTFASHCEVVALGSSELVEMAELKLAGTNPPLDKIRAIVEPFRQRTDLDTVILACTHFPLLEDELKAALPEVRNWINSGEAVARRVSHLYDIGKIRERSVTPTVTGYFTAKTAAAAKLGNILVASFGFSETRFLPDLNQRV